MKVCGGQGVGRILVQFDRMLIFSEYLQIATAKAIQYGANLARLMPNIGGPREAKRKLVTRLVHSKLLYAAPVWASAFNNHATQKKSNPGVRHLAG